MESIYPKKLSPRAELAAHLLGTGVARTQREAGEMAGFHPGTLAALKSIDYPIDEAVDVAQDQFKQHLMSTHQLLQVLGRQAVEKIALIMNAGEKEDNQLRAARDLADRSMETSRVTRSLNVGVSMSREDAQALSAALVEGAHIRAAVQDGGEVMSVNQEAPVASLANPVEFTFRTEEEKDG